MEGVKEVQGKRERTRPPRGAARRRIARIGSPKESGDHRRRWVVHRVQRRERFSYPLAQLAEICCDVRYVVQHWVTACLQVIALIERYIRFDHRADFEPDWYMAEDRAVMVGRLLTLTNYLVLC